ncbi:hypothetical protein JKP88DRAFT_316836 [Tribonema minus]|uniref:TIR domain-containing protein n=1 Tax=Tribonema minus TaxID=303371 RepID=A0A835Z5C2_9STRA|nr:hypothetical protein JKP88DRAFT_316836 [Tribonema minus]
MLQEKQQLTMLQKQQQHTGPVVYISHAGLEKKFLADTIYRTLVSRGVAESQIFLDDHSMRAGLFYPQSEQALASAKIGILLLSKDFVTREWPMRELHALLEKVVEQEPVELIPVFCQLTTADLKGEGLTQLYDTHDWGKSRRPAPDVEEQWRRDLQKLCAYQGHRLDQSRGFHGMLAADVAMLTLNLLEEKGLQVVVGRRAPQAFLRRYTDQLLGRDELVERIKIELLSKRALLLHGGAGVGKTSVGMEAAAQLEEQGHFSAGTFMVDFKGLRVADSFNPCDAVKAHIAVAMYMQLLQCEGGIQARDGALRAWEEQWGALLSWLSGLKRQGRKALLAFDDAEEAIPAGAAYDLASVLEELRQYETSTTLLVMSRENTGRYRSFGVLEVEPLTDGFAQALVSAGITMTDRDAQILSSYCGGNPLMLTGLASFMRRRPHRLQEVILAVQSHAELPLTGKSGFKVHVAQLIAWLNAFLDQHDKDSVAQLSTFPDSFSTSGAAAMLDSGIDAVVGAAGTGQKDVEDTLRRLCSLSILRRQFPNLLRPLDLPGGPRYTMPAIYRAAAHTFLTPEVETLAQQKFAQFVVSIASDLRKCRLDQGAFMLKPGLELLSSEQQNLQKLTRLIASDFSMFMTASWARKLNAPACELQAWRQLAEAEQLYIHALAINEKVLGPKHQSTATSLNDLGGLFQTQGKLAEAEPLYIRALAIREELLGPKHPDTASSLFGLASLLQAKGKLAEAEPLCRRALTIYEDVLGPMHPRTAQAISTLASLLTQQGNLAEAEPLYRRALAIMEAQASPHHPHVLMLREKHDSVLRKLEQCHEARRKQSWFTRAWQAITDPLDFNAAAEAQPADFTDDPPRKPPKRGEASASEALPADFTDDPPRKPPKRGELTDGEALPADFTDDPPRKPPKRGQLPDREALPADFTDDPPRKPPKRVGASDGAPVTSTRYIHTS